MAIKEETVMLTPMLAEKLLSTNYEKQRKLNIGYARSLANDIATGRWDDSVLRDPLEISDKGKLMNGQHRCKAVILSNQPIKARLITGTPENQFSLIDCGKARATNQFVHTRYSREITSLGTKVSCIEAGMPIASAIKGIVGNARGDERKYSVHATRQQILSCIDRHQERFMLCAEKAQPIYRAMHGGNKSDFAFALYLIGETHGVESISSFVDEIASNLTVSEAIALGKSRGSKTIIDAKSKHVSIDSKFWVALILEMYDGWAENRKLQRGDWVNKSINKYNTLLNLVQERQA